MIGWTLIALLVVMLGLEILVDRSRHDLADTLANVLTYAPYLLISTAWAPILFELYSTVHDHALLDLGPYWLDPKTPRFYAFWVVLFILDDFAFYAFHRASHRAPLLWAAHVTHHSSQRFNLSVALRQSWTPFIAVPFWLPLPLLGFDPLMVLAMQFLSLFYQACLHTELVPRLGVLEWLLNTPTHHRVHHGTNSIYVDKNFGGVLIVWDRLFGTFAELSEPVEYGIGRRVIHPLIGIHGWIDLFRRKEVSS